MKIDEKTTMNIRKKTLKKLLHLKINKNLKSANDVIEMLLKNYKGD